MCFSAGLGSLVKWYNHTLNQGEAKRGGEDRAILDRLINEQIHELLRQKDKAILEAIDSVLGRNASDEEWAKRGRFTRYGDGTEELSIDGNSVIRFYPVAWEQEWDDEAQTTRARLKQRYEWL